MIHPRLPVAVPLPTSKRVPDSRNTYILILFLITYDPLDFGRIRYTTIVISYIVALFSLFHPPIYMILEDIVCVVCFVWLFIYMLMNTEAMKRKEQSAGKSQLYVDQQMNT